MVCMTLPASLTGSSEQYERQHAGSPARDCRSRVVMSALSPGWQAATFVLAGGPCPSPAAGRSNARNESGRPLQRLLAVGWPRNQPPRYATRDR